MRTLLLIAFWVCVFSTSISLISMAVRDYPYTSRHSLGEEMAKVVVGLVWMFFVSRAIWEWI